MNESTEIPIEMHTKICKKIAQLTKVIYTLNSRAEEQDVMMQKLKESHENDIKRIILECKSKVLKFKNQSQNLLGKEKEFIHLQDLVKDLRGDNMRLQNALESQLEKATLHEKQLQSDYENKYLILQNKFLEQKRYYDELVHSFKSFQNEIESNKIQLTEEIRVKYLNEIKQMSLSHEKDILAVTDAKATYEYETNKQKNEFNILQAQWITEKQEMNSEYENKYAKLKSFYEKEIEHITLKNEDKEKLEQEKSLLTNNFELAKSDLNNRIRFLERKVEDSESLIEKYQNDCTSLENRISELNLKCENSVAMVDDKSKTITELTDIITTKKTKMESIMRELAEYKSKFETLREDTLLKVNRKDADLLKLKETCESTKKQLLEVQTKLHTVETGFSLLQEENNNITDKIVQISGEKDETEAMYKNAQSTLQEKNKELDVLLLKLKESKELQNLTAKDLENRYAKELQNERDKHTGNIKKFKEETEKILQESQNKLLEEFAKEKENVLNETNTVIAKKDTEINKLQEQLKGVNAQFENLNKNLKDLEDQLNNKKNINTDLKLQLCDVKKLCMDSEEKCNRLQTQLDSLKSGLDQEKDRFIQEKKELEEHLETKFKEQIEDLDEQWKENSGMTFNSAVMMPLWKVKLTQSDLRRRLQEESEVILKQMKTQHENEIEVLRSEMDNDNVVLNHQISRLKAIYGELEHTTSDDKTKFREQIEHAQRQFEEEKEKLIASYKTGVEKLKNIHENEKNESLKQLHDSHNLALEESQEKQRLSLDELQNEHSILVKALKSQYVAEKEAELKNLHDKLSSEKETLREFFILQNEERVKHLSGEYEQQISDIKNELGRSNELRQKEFSVHTEKISALVQSLDKEKTQVENFKLKLNVLEEEARTLRKELEAKVEEVLGIRRECNSRLRSHTDDMSHEHELQMETLKAAHLRELQACLAEWMEKQSYLEDQISTLKLILEEGEERFRNRPSREEDILFISKLQQKILEQDLECKKLGDERKLYRLELVNREENFNKVFKTSPNIGFMNPLEQAKRRSAKKK